MKGYHSITTNAMFWFEIRCVSWKFMKRKKKLLLFDIWCNVDNRKKSKIVIRWPIITQIKDTFYDSANLILIKTFLVRGKNGKYNIKLYKCTRKRLWMQFTMFKVRFQIRQKYDNRYLVNNMWRCSPWCSALRNQIHTNYSNLSAKIISLRRKINKFRRVLNFNGFTK